MARMIEGYSSNSTNEAAKTQSALAALKPKQTSTQKAVAALRPNSSANRPPASIAASKRKSSSSSSSRSSGSSSSGSSRSTSSRASSYSAPSSSSGVSSGSSSMRSTGSNSTGQVSTLAASAPTTPPVPTESAFLGKDSTYLAQMAAMQKAMADYRAQMGQNQNQYNTDYASRLNDLGINKQQSLDNQADDYASRGMYVSGVYGHDRSDLLGQFSRRQADMDSARSNFLSGLQSDFSNFQNDQQVTNTQAKQDALARRAQQYGLTAV